MQFDLSPLVLFLPFIYLFDFTFWLFFSLGFSLVFCFSRRQCTRSKRVILIAVGLHRQVSEWARLVRVARGLSSKGSVGWLRVLEGAQPPTPYHSYTGYESDREAILPSILSLSLGLCASLSFSLSFYHLVLYTPTLWPRLPLACLLARLSTNIYIRDCLLQMDDSSGLEIRVWCNIL